MELQNQLNEETSRYFHNEEDTNEDNGILFNNCSTLRMDGNSNPYCNYWMHSYSGSYAKDARIRLETLKSGSSSPPETSSMNESMYSYNYSKDIWEFGLNELSALDAVDLIDVERLEQNEESWLYVSPKCVAFEEKTEPALRWCRRVLDNPSPEMEAACRHLINKLNLKLSRENRHPGLQQTGNFSFNSSVDSASFSPTIPSSSFDYSDHDTSPISNYRLQNITDVYDIARLQEASLRQEYVHTPRGPESPLRLPSRSNTSATNSSNNIHGNRTETSSCQSSVPARDTGEKNCLSPKVTRLLQYKLLKRAQNQGSSSRSSSPLRTSLRSLQAVRSSRSLDIDDFNPDHILHPKPDASPARTSSVCRSSPHSTHHPDSADVKVQSKAIKRCQRSHSLSPCRIPHPALSRPDRVFSSPQNSRAAAWLRPGRQLQRSMPK